MSEVDKSETQTEVSNPLQAERTDTLEAAVSRLLKEPEDSVTPTEEPEDTAEPEDLEEDASEDEQEVEADPDEDEGELEEGDEQPEGEEEPVYYAVKIDGEEYEVSLDELQSGYQRQKDYTKKTQTLAEQRKTYESKAAELEQLQSQYMQQAQLANELLNRDLKKFEKVDWETMKTEDPVGYLQKQIEVQDIRQQQQQLHQQAQVAYEHNQKVQAEERQQYLEMQRKETLNVFPDWKDSEKADKHRTSLADYGRSIGYTDEDLAQVVTAKDLVILDKAMKYDALVKTKKGISTKQTPKAIRKAVKTKGLAPKGVSRQKTTAEKSDRLRKSGSLKDAAALMYELQTQKQVRKS